MDLSDINLAHDFSYIIGGIFAFIILVFIVLRFKSKNKKQEKTSESKALFVPKEGFAKSIKNIFLGTDKRLEDIVPDLEEVLLAADVGVVETEKLVSNLLEHKGVKTKDEAFQFLKDKIKTELMPKSEFEIDQTKNPYVIYIVGVNGVGKTTTIGKLAYQFKEDGKKVMLVAADTFRAAAVEQLRIWSEKNQVEFIGGKTNADPSSVIVDGLRSAQAKKIDVVLVDTAGRLQTKTNLMNELKKMVRMSERELGRDPDEIFLVVDAITGQNGFSQAQIFLDACPLSGIILAKYDATSKGGIILSIVQQTGLPIRYLGMGEGIKDLKKFDSTVFVEKLFG